MTDQEKKLIENLFYRLKNTELNSSERDESADVLIKNLVHNQPSSSYYMIQTILIQETAIEKMNAQIEDLKQKLSQLELNNETKKTSFLSGFFSKKKSPLPIFSQKNSVRNNDEFSPSAYNTNTSTPSPLVQQPQSNHGNSFLSNALQTATGVAGGMIVGNVLMNAFKHTKSEEEIFNTAHHVENNSDNNMHQNTDTSTIYDENNENFIKHEEHHLESQKHNNDDYQCDSNNQLHHHVHENDCVDSTDINDDNFI